MIEQVCNAPTVPVVDVTNVQRRQIARRFASWARNHPHDARKQNVLCTKTIVALTNEEIFVWWNLIARTASADLPKSIAEFDMHPYYVLETEVIRRGYRVH